MHTSDDEPLCGKRSPKRAGCPETDELAVSSAPQGPAPRHSLTRAPSPRLIFPPQLHKRVREVSEDVSWDGPQFFKSSMDAILVLL